MPIQRHCFRRSAVAGGTARIWPMKIIKNRTLRPALAIAAAAAISVAFAGCSAKSDTSPQTASVTPTNVKLTEAQLKNIQLYSVKPSTYHKTIETSGAVDFDNDQATS